MFAMWASPKKQSPFQSNSIRGGETSPRRTFRENSRKASPFGRKSSRDDLDRPNAEKGPISELCSGRRQLCCFSAFCCSAENRRPLRANGNGLISCSIQYSRLKKVQCDDFGLGPFAALSHGSGFLKNMCSRWIRPQVFDRIPRFGSEFSFPLYFCFRVLYKRFYWFFVL